MAIENYSYFDEGETNFNLENPDQEYLDFIRTQPQNLGFFSTNVAQNPAMVNYGLTSLPEFDMANLPMYEKDDDEQVDYLPGQEPSGIAQLVDYLPFGEKSLAGALLRNFLPQESPEIKNIKNFYRQNYGLDSIGRVDSGIMKGYNPVSGSDFLNKITGGLLPARSFGLADAARRRIQKIATRKAPQTDFSRNRIQELQDFARADTISRARQANPGVYEGRSGGFDTSAADKAGTSAGSGQFSPSTSRGRSGY